MGYNKYLYYCYLRRLKELIRFKETADNDIRRCNTVKYLIKAQAAGWSAQRVCFSQGRLHRKFHFMQAFEKITGRLHKCVLALCELHLNSEPRYSL